MCIQDSKVVIVAQVDPQMSMVASSRIDQLNCHIHLILRHFTSMWPKRRLGMHELQRHKKWATHVQGPTRHLSGLYLWT